MASLRARRACMRCRRQKLRVCPLLIIGLSVIASSCCKVYQRLTASHSVMMNDPVRCARALMLLVRTYLSWLGKCCLDKTSEGVKALTRCRKHVTKSSNATLLNGAALEAKRQSLTDDPRSATFDSAHSGMTPVLSGQQSDTHLPDEAPRMLQDRTSTYGLINEVSPHYSCHG